MTPVDRGCCLVEGELHRRGEETGVAHLRVVLLVQVVQNAVRTVGVVIEVLEVELVIFLVLHLWVEVDHFVRLWLRWRTNLFVFYL